MCTTLIIFQVGGRDLFTYLYEVGNRYIRRSEYDKSQTKATSKTHHVTTETHPSQNLLCSCRCTQEETRQA